LNITGSSLYSSINQTGAGIAHANFAYLLETPLVVGPDLTMEVQVDYTTIMSDYGGLNIMAYSNSDVIWRFAYSSISGLTYSYAMNYCDSVIYDDDISSGPLGYTSMW
jgi:hypothetical protein